MSVFEYDNYKIFVRKFFETLPRRGRGQFKRLSEHLGIHTSMVSHIFNGEHHLNQEQALRVCQFLGLCELESEFFITLVDLARASTHDLREFNKRKMVSLRDEGRKLEKKYPDFDEFSEQSQAVYYSKWYYSAIRLLTDIKKYRSPEAIAEVLGLPIGVVREAVTFLVQNGYLSNERGELRLISPRATVSVKAPFIKHHQLNWRVKSLNHLGSVSPTELMSTNLVTASEKDIERIREKIFVLFKEIMEIVEDSPPEKLACLNVDWLIPLETR